ncbi:hypothetical protein [Nocardia nova]|uniref:hypothetical protein n=1 Tax=Nocardia nova TaxID=37330 RepID=UPI000AEAABF2|nr:hypothetical protein [Nocardia nova]
MLEDAAREEESRELLTEWEREVAQLREMGDRIRWLADRLRPRHRNLEVSYLGYLVDEFKKIVDANDRASFDSLVLHTSDLHHRNMGVLDPDYGPAPERSSFVRRIPDSTEPIRDPFVYVNHIVESLEHFVQVWTTVIDCGLTCDWEMLEDEFPKLATLSAEIDRAHTAWISLETD